MAIIGTKKRAALFTAALGIALGVAMNAMAATPFSVPLDQARPLTLKAPAQGVVIGNPSIAGVTLQNDRLLFVTGKAYGTTNLIIVGEGGRPIYEGLITVTAGDGADGTLTLTRGLTTIRQTCSPICRKTPEIGDDAVELQTYQGQVQAHSQGSTR